MMDGSMRWSRSDPNNVGVKVIQANAAVVGLGVVLWYAFGHHGFEGMGFFYDAAVGALIFGAAAYTAGLVFAVATDLYLGFLNWREDRRRKQGE